MKALRIVPCLLLSVLAAYADVTIEQKVESPAVSGTMIMKVKDQKARIDMPSPAGAATTFIDMDSGEMKVLMHAQKMGMTMNMKDMVKKAEEQQKATGVDPAKVKPVATGKKQKVGNWNAEEFTADVAGMQFSLWVSQDVPNWQAVKDQMNKFSKSMSAGSFDPNAFDLPGVVVRTEMSNPQFKMNSELVSVNEGAVPAAEFEVPQGYQMMPVPAQ